MKAENDPTFGTITLYQDIGDGPVLFCTLELGVPNENVCPAASTVFDYEPFPRILTAHYHADSTYADSDAPPVYVTVEKDPTSLGLTTSASPATLGSPVKFTATVTGLYPAIPNGPVVFSLDGIAQQPVSLGIAGTASMTTSTLALGMHTIAASYAGYLDFEAATDVTIPQQIVPPMTTTTVVSSLNPSNSGDAVTFRAYVIVGGGSTAAPTGGVKFNDGTAAFATQPLKQQGGQNVAQTTISTLAVGTHNITAMYAGDADTSPSLSQALPQVVKQSPQYGYNITVTPSPVTVGVGVTAKLTVTVTETGGFASPVTLSCSNLPNESTCTFDEATIPAGGGTTTLEMTTMAPHDCGSQVPYFTGPALQASLHMSRTTSFVKIIRYGAPALAGVVALLLPGRRRRWMKRLLMVVALCGIFSLSGCTSHCTDFGTQPGSYTFNVNGSAAGVDPPAANGGNTPVTAPAASVTTSVALTVEL